MGSIYSIKELCQFVDKNEKTDILILFENKHYMKCSNEILQKIKVIGINVFTPRFMSVW